MLRGTTQQTHRRTFGRHCIEACQPTRSAKTQRTCLQEGPDVVVAPVQNGVDAHEGRPAGRRGAERFLVGRVWVAPAAARKGSTECMSSQTDSELAQQLQAGSIRVAPAATARSSTPGSGTQGDQQLGQEGQRIPAKPWLFSSAKHSRKVAFGAEDSTQPSTPVIRPHLRVPSTMPCTCVCASSCDRPCLKSPVRISMPSLGIEAGMRDGS